MSAKRKKTVLKTVRLTQELDSLLRGDAEAGGMTVNSLINRIMTKYVEWDRHIEKFRFISIADETFRSILEEVDDSKVEQIATDMGSKMPKAVTLFWFKRLNLDTVLKTISNYGKYSGLHTNEIRFDEGECIITFHHELGRKWSMFLKNLISQYIKTGLGIVPQTEITDSMVLVSFYTRSSRSKD
jgi:hypothetical protein